MSAGRRIVRQGKPNAAQILLAVTVCAAGRNLRLLARNRRIVEEVVEAFVRSELTD
jgi:hypothetical protein